MPRLIRAVPVLCAALMVSCGGEDPPAEPGPDSLATDCPWFRQCGGECGVCDDGDPCTGDRCLGGYTCGHLPVAGCECQGGCAEAPLVPIHRLARGDGGLPGPVGPMDVALSADERHVYLPSAETGAVVHLVEHGGAFRWGGTTAAPGAVAARLSPGERWLYVGHGEALSVLPREPGTGRLGDGASFAVPAEVLAVSPSRLAAGSTEGVRLFTHPADGGTPGERGVLASSRVRETRGLTFAGDVLLVASAAGALTAWRITDGGADLAGEVAGEAGLRGANAVAYHDGRAYVAGFCDHAVAIVRVDPGGALTHVGSEGRGLGAPQCGPLGVDRRDPNVVLEHPTALAVMPGGARLAVAIKARGLQVVYYAIEGDGLRLDGFLQGRPPFDDYSDEDFHLHPPDLPNPFDVEPERFRSTTAVAAGTTRLFAASRFDNALAVVRDGALEQVVQRGDGGVGSIPGAYNLALSPDDRHVYVAPRVHGAVGAFALGADGGLAELAQAPVPREDALEAGGLTNVAVTPDGSQVLAVDTTPPALYVHDRDTETGALTFVAAYEIPECDGNLPLPVDVVVSPDGASVYVADFQDDGSSCVVAWPRAAGGELGEPVRYDDPLVAGVESFALTVAGDHLYAASFHASAVAHYRREADGTLVAQAGITHPDLAGAEFVILSPDETVVWVSTPVHHKLMTFARDLETGALTHLQTLSWPDEPIHGAAGLAVSPEGDRVFLASRLSGNLTAWDVAADGTLSRVQTLDDRPGLGWVNGVALTSDGSRLVTSAVAASAVSTFRVQPR